MTRPWGRCLPVLNSILRWMQCLERKGILKLGVCSLIGTCLCGTADGRFPAPGLWKGSGYLSTSFKWSCFVLFTTISITILVASLQIDLHWASRFKALFCRGNVLSVCGLYNIQTGTTRSLIYYGPILKLTASWLDSAMSLRWFNSEGRTLTVWFNKERFPLETCSA